MLTISFWARTAQRYTALGGLAELLLLMLLTHVCLDYPDTGQIFLDIRVQGVVFIEHFTEIFSYASHQEGNDDS